MTRINTNVSSLVAQKTLARSQSQLQTALTRLSTGLRINVGKDDPAGLIASEVLRSDIISVNRAITNSERANQLIATADSALGQVSSLLNDIRGLVSEAANTGALSDEQIKANQLQIDSSLEAIDRISQTTSFQGRRLLDGSLSFITTNVGTADVKASGTFGTVADVNASGNFGATPDANATITVSGSGAGVGNVTFTALSAGTAGNNLHVIYTRVSGTAAAAATYNGGTNTLTITAASAATADSVVNAVAGNASAAAVLSATAAAAGTIFSAAAATVSTTLAGGTFNNNIVLSAATAGSRFNLVDITFADTTATGAESATYSTATNTLTISKHANSTTAQVIGAINTNGVFSGSTGGAGFGTYAAATTSDVTSGGTDNNAITLSARIGGTAYNNLTIDVVNSVATGAETAAYSTATNTLTITKSANSTTAQVLSAINTTAAFSASTSGAGLGVYSAGTTLNVTTGGATGSASISDLKIDQANFGTGNSVAVAVDVDAQATQASLTYSGGTLAADLVLQIGGQNGFEIFNFGAGTEVADIAAGLNQSSDATGVTATVTGTGLTLNSTGYGTDAFVTAKVIGQQGSFDTLAGGIAADRATGTDVDVRINGVKATGQGLKASINTASLDLSFSVNSALGAGDAFSFNITGGGAIFQLGPDVVSNQQARIGIQGVSSSTLGGVSGTLFELRSGGAKDLKTDVKGAARVVDEVITSVTSLRGRLGAFQKTTLETNIFTLNDTLENLTAAESSIRDADFAAESANLTRAQILVQSGTSVLQISNQNPQSVLALLRG